MFCIRCGKQIPDDSLFCEHCGAPLSPAPPPPAPVPDPEPAKPSASPAGFVRTASMTEAAAAAVQRNPGLQWSYWDDPRHFSYSPDRLMRFCGKEDKRLAGEAVSYIVSSGGAIGVSFTEGGKEMLQWAFFTPGDQPESLPESSV